MEKSLVGLAKSLDILARSKNSAAVDAILAGLDTNHPPSQEATLRALFHRSEPILLTELLRRWHQFGPRTKQLVADHAERFENALRGALLSLDTASFAAACQAAVRLRSYETIATLGAALIGPHDPRQIPASQAMLAMADELHDELANPRDYRIRRDPQLARKHLVGELETISAKYETHFSVAPIEALLTLTSRDNPMLKRVLHSPKDPVYGPMCDVLSRSSRPGVVRLLLGYLDEYQVPHAIMEILSNRSDVFFLRHFFKRVAGEHSAQMKANLQRLESLAWIPTLASRVIAFNDSEQASLVRLLMATGLPRHTIFEALQQILRRGSPQGRSAAVHALEEYKGAAANQELLLALNDPEPIVQAAALTRMKGRSLANANDAILTAVRSDEALVQAAVREALEEFTFPKFRSVFESLKEDVRRRLGPLIKHLHPDSVETLRVEINNEQHSRRVKALVMIEAMEAGKELEFELLAILAGEDHALAHLAAQALVDCPTVTTRDGLTKAMQHASVLVREAAAESLERIENLMTNQTSA